MKSLAERIARGEVELLGIADICDRLQISRLTFGRWVQKGKAGKTTGASPTFPEADIYIGGSPKWELQSLIDWLTLKTTSKGL